jgi:spore germination protein KB
MFPIILIFVLIITYSQKCGIEVLARVGEFLFPAFLLLFIIIVLAVLGSGMLKSENLQPVLETGWAPIWNVSFPLCASQGFAQTLEVAMIWPLVNSTKKNIAKTTIFATLVSGAVIFITQLMLITGLDGYSYKAGSYPMYILISKISIGGFIQHLDVFGVLFFIISAFFKVSLHMFFSIRGIQLLTNTGNVRNIIIFISLLSVYLGYSVSLNSQEHILVAFKVFPYNLWFPLLWVLPFSLLFLTLTKKAIMRVKNS